MWRKTIKPLTFSYLLGCIAAMIAWPHSIVLVSVPLFVIFPLFVVYPILSPVGYLLYYLYLSDGYRFGGGPVEWAHYMFGMLPILGVMILWGSPSKARTLALGLIGFPVGFIGTLALYFTAAASI